MPGYSLFSNFPIMYFITINQNWYLQSVLCLGLLKSSAKLFYVNIFVLETHFAIIQRSYIFANKNSLLIAIYYYLTRIVGQLSYLGTLIPIPKFMWLGCLEFRIFDSLKTFI